MIMWLRKVMLMAQQQIQPFHGAITSLSPVKKGRNSIFIDGMLADDTS
jgi:hypothetical protein